MQARGWPFCFIGGLAVIRWGEVRMTQDIDICLLSGFGNEKIYIDRLLEIFRPRISDADVFAIKNRVLLFSVSNGVDIDLTFSGLRFEERMIERATPYQYSPGCSLITCSAEDLIVLKAFAGRMKDWSDIEGIITRSGEGLDTGYIFSQLEPLCEVKESPETIEKLHILLSSLK
ncbi:MAG: hypothetical protein EHM85_10535 [Desulfobacteraceae bacterium]|nr:MAG: hypothetical protein EHM85_10535 [Desulfobacteraceae bacterium]